MDIEISPSKVLVVLLFIIGFLLLANLAGIVSVYVFDRNTLLGSVRLFDFNRETNFPTLYSSLQLLVASSLLLFISDKLRLNGANYIAWLVLAVIFLFLAIDETIQIHERLTAPFRAVFELPGLAFVAWIIPYGIGVLLLVIAFSRFLFRLPSETARRFLGSGAIYVIGAMGFEVLGARHAAFHGSKNIAFAMFYTCEELLEMLGVALFIYALLLYIASEFQYLRVTIKN